MRAVSLISGTTAAALGISALVLIPVSAGEGWKSDPIVTVMLVLSFVLFALACHALDRHEKRTSISKRAG